MAEEKPDGLLAAIETPADLRALARADLGALSDELRQYLIETVGPMGGHLAAGLGTVELAVALHYIFDTPYDRLIWDVGHQAYPHKVLTGRRRRLGSIKQRGGLAPFPARAESVYDGFGVGHSSTSISAALGMAVANRLSGSDRRVVAVIGDGAMSAGLAWEALNHAGSLDVDLLVVLNDNDMSISENVGALSNYFARLLSGRMYAHLRAGGKKVLRKMPSAWELARRSEVHAKGMVLPGTLFEEMGFNYIGPIDGHDINALVTTLGNMRSLPGPQFLHVVTQKGKGYAPAEADPIKWHGPGPYDPASGTLYKEKAAGPTYSQVFGEWLCDIAEQDARIVGITPAMREGSGMVEFERRFPERYFDVAIAEQHAVTLAAGLACDGMRPVVAIYSTFLQRGYDQLIHDVALQRLPVVFAIDRAGLVGGDGATHQGVFDLTYLRCVPNMVVMAPADENECRQMLYTAGLLDGPSAVRYPRGRGPGVAVEKTMQALPVGRAELRRSGASGLGPARVRHDGRGRAARSRVARRNAREHALRETTRRGADRRGRRQPSRARDARGECIGRRRGLGRARSAAAARQQGPRAPGRRPRHVRGARFARGQPGGCRARSGGGPRRDRALLARTGHRAGAARGLIRTNMV